MPKVRKLRKSTASARSKPLRSALDDHDGDDGMSVTSYEDTHDNGDDAGEDGDGHRDTKGLSRGQRKRKERRGQIMQKIGLKKITILSKKQKKRREKAGQSALMSELESNLMAISTRDDDGGTHALCNCVTLR